MTPLTPVEAYAVANTPLYLIRKLRETEEVGELVRTKSGDQIFELLRQATAKHPVEPMDYVAPYMCLVALSMKSDDNYLKAAGALPNTANWDWFDYIRQVLIEATIPTERVVLAASAKPTPPVTAGSDSTVDFGPAFVGKTTHGN